MAGPCQRKVPLKQSDRPSSHYGLRRLQKNPFRGSANVESGRGVRAKVRALNRGLASRIPSGETVRGKTTAPLGQI